MCGSPWKDEDALMMLRLAPVFMVILVLVEYE